MRIASVLGVTMGLLLCGASASTTMSAQDPQPPAAAPSPGIGHFGSLFATPTLRDLVGNRLTPPRPPTPEDLLAFQVSATRSIRTAPHRQAIRSLRNDVAASGPSDRRRNPTFRSE
jgi:hypothetical protein